MVDCAADHKGGGRMRKRAVNLEGLAARLRSRVVVLELGGLPAFLRPDGADTMPVPGRRRRPEQVPGPDAEPRSCVAGGRIAAMVELTGQ